MTEDCGVRVMRAGTACPDSYPKPVLVHGEPSSRRRPRKGGRKSKYQCRKCKREFMSDVTRPKCPFKDCGHGCCARVHVGGNGKIE